MAKRQPKIILDIPKPDDFSFDRDFGEEFICYRGYAIEISCPAAKAKKFSVTNNVEKVTCPECLKNWNNNKKEILRKYAKNHGTYSLYVELECRCNVCCLFWMRRQVANKIRKELMVDFEVSKERVNQFLFKRVNHDSDDLFIDLYINDPKKFRALAMSHLMASPVSEDFKLPDLAQDKIPLPENLRIFELDLLQ